MGALGLLAAVCLFAAMPADAGASRAKWRAASRELAVPWPKIRRRDGSLPDAIREGRRARYGNGMAGLGLLQTGVREHRRRLVRVGLRAVSAETRRLFDSPSVQQFRIWAVASSYSLANRRLRHWRSARAALRRWAHWLRHQRTFWLSRPGYQNKTLVEAVAVLELLRTGLRSHARRAIVGGGRRRAWRQVLRLVNRGIPRRVPRQGVLLSDPGNHPPAYHALSYGMYARAVVLLGRRASPRVRPMLRRLAGTTARMTAPTGDLAYWGRSQGEKWTLSSAAYGLAVTARVRGSSGRPARSYRALADRLLRRLAEYGAGPRGEWIVPSVRQSLRAGRRSLDYYAHAPEYTGLALVYLNLAIPVLPRRSTAGPIASDRNMHTSVGQGRARFAVVRQGPLWYAVRPRGTGGFRYDFGPVALKRLEGGVWRDLLPLRPIGHGGTGPILRSGRRSGVPVGTSLSVARGGLVLIRGGFRWRGRWLRRGVRFRIGRLRCGLLLSFTARAGDQYRFTGFFAGVRDRERGPNYVRVADRVATFSEPVFSTRFASARPSVSNALLTRARFSVRVRSPGPVHMTIC